MAAWARLSAPSFVLALATCRLTVASAIREPPGDRLGRQPLGDQPQDLELALAQRRTVGGADHSPLGGLLGGLRRLDGRARGLAAEQLQRRVGQLEGRQLGPGRPGARDRV